MDKTRDTYKYILKRDGVIIFRGVTSDLTRRGTEHKVRFPDSVVQQIGRKTTRVAALKWLRSQERKV